MTTLTDRPNGALLVIDVQKDVMSASHGSDAVIANISTLVDRARAAGAPVIWVQHSYAGMPFGSDSWNYVDELPFGEGEAVVHKTFGDSFEATDLEETLASLRVGALTVCGAQTDACIRSTIHGAFVRGYDVTLVGDAHTTEDLSEWGAPSPEAVVAHTNLYWGFQKAPGRTAAVVDTSEVTFA
jgi:nicotinamidase-related amidase